MDRADGPAAKDGKPHGNVSAAREPAHGFTAVGYVTRPHGLDGELRVRPYSESALNLRSGRFVYADGLRRQISASRPDRNALLVQLAGVDSREEAEDLVGMLLEAPDGDVLRDGEDSFFVHELVGLDVVLEDGTALGKLSEVLVTGSADVYVVTTHSDGEFLFPAISDVVRQIDVSGGRIVIAPQLGTLD